MAKHPVLLCIHRDPERLNVLQENGYELLVAGNGHEGLQLFVSRRVDAVVLEYTLGLLDGSEIASKIKRAQPNIPIVMLAEPEELPAGALQAVDAFVPTSDPPHFLWAAVHFALSARRLENCRTKPRAAQIAPNSSPEKSRAWRILGTVNTRVADARITPLDETVQF